MHKHVFPLLLLALLALAGCGCSPDKTLLHDGYYSAVASSFNKDGWKHFITLYVYNNKIVTAEYNARNASGLILSWDGIAMRKLKTGTRVHPNRIIREYTQELLNRQDPQRIRKIPGDTYFYDTFKKLAAAAIEQAKIGDRTLAEIDLAETTTGTQ